MSTNIEDQSRSQIAEFLPESIRKALTSYKNFMEEKNENDTAKVFKEHHLACKVAVSHIDLLLKLARWADLPALDVQNQNDRAVLQAALCEAEKELRGYEDNATTDEDDDE